MPILPSRSDVHVNKMLTNFSVAYMQDTADFVCDKVFPVVPVQKQSDRYFRYPKDYWFRTGAAKRAPGTESAGGGFHIDNTPTYFCNVWAWHMDLDDQTRTNVDQPIDLDRDATEFVTRNLLLRRELVFMKNYMSPGIWQGYTAPGQTMPSDYSPATKWSNVASNPMGDIDMLKSFIKSQTGFKPNKMVVSEDVFYTLRNNASVLDRIKYTQRGLVTEDLLATLFGVDQFLVAGAVLNSSQEGQAASMGFMLANRVLLVYSNPAPSILKPSGGYCFTWTGLFGAGAEGNRISQFRMEALKSDRLEGELSFDFKLVCPDTGCLLTNLI